MDNQLGARIDDLEREAAALRADVLRTPVFAQEEAGTWTRFQRFGQTALALFREVARRLDADPSPDPSPGKSDSERMAARIEAAYQRVHEAIQAVADLALSGPQPVPAPMPPADEPGHRPRAC